MEPLLNPELRTFDGRETEQMDQPQPVSQELERTLRDLEALNRRFGGHRYVRRFLQKHLKVGHTYRVLDLATGGGDFPRMMVDWSRKHRIALAIDALDNSRATISLARQFSADYPEIRFVEWDIRNFRARCEYDLVHCSLSMHHFPAEEAVEILKKCREMSRNMVLITDLERSLLNRFAIHLVNVLFRHHRMTQHDGDDSARRAFSYREFRMLAKGAGWTTFHHERFLFCRQALWLVRP